MHTHTYTHTHTQPPGISHPARTSGDDVLLTKSSRAQVCDLCKRKYRRSLANKMNLEVVDLFSCYTDAPFLVTWWLYQARNFQGKHWSGVVCNIVSIVYTPSLCCTEKFSPGNVACIPFQKPAVAELPHSFLNALPFRFELAASWSQCNCYFHLSISLGINIYGLFFRFYA